MTKNIDLIKLPKKKYEAIKKIVLKQAIESAGKKTLDEYNQKFSFLVEYFQRAISNGQVQYYIESKDVTYDCRLGGLTGNWDKTEYDSYLGVTPPEMVKVPDLVGFSGELPSLKELGYFIRIGGSAYWVSYCGKNYAGVIYKNGAQLQRIDTAHYTNGFYRYTMGETGGYDTSEFLLFPVHHFHGIDANITANQVVLDLLMHDLPVSENVFENKTQYDVFSNLIKACKLPGITADGNKLGLDIDLLYREALNGKKPFFMNEADYNAIINGTATAYEVQLKDLVDNLLNCDYNRACLDPYDNNLLIDPNRGHWDLWDMDDNSADDGGIVKLPKPWVARNPVADINSGIVAIDFGTKSTVVVYKNENSEILPLQVGSGNYAGGIKKENYENPTIVQFLDINSFMKAYNAKAGRPDTSYEDITVSSNAKQNFDVSSSTEYYSFFDELKQWCGGSKEKVKIEDKQGNTYDLPAYLDLLDTDIDPIEIYAYYLGLYINNMLQEKHIFMHYIMSFPVNYERNIREKLLRSFAKGLKKSLPTALLSNEEAMKRFKVVEGATEPAAYACTALMEFGFDPVDEEKNYYGVFDFGGGTTDFDFGMLEELADGRYDYKLTHFGENGDRTLGGENLLKLMAFEVFSKNYEKLLRNEKGDKIPFCTAPDSETIVGNEAIIRESREAKQNMHNLVEKLRPVWEAPDSEEATQLLNKASVQVNLFTDKGVQVPNFPLSLEHVDLLEIIHDRIEKGIRNFFISLNQAFQSGGDEVDNLSDVAEIAIFMAGNSSKAEVVTEIFNEYIGESEDGTAPKALELFDVASKEEMPHFRLYPPLGTPQADEIKSAALQDDEEDDSDEDDVNNLMRPTGKTGVAYGLLETCAGGSIKVVDQQASARNEVSFQFYIGKNRKKKFVTLMSRGADYDTWVKFIDASDDFDLLYSDKPEAATNKAPVSIAKRYHVVLDKKDPAGYVFIKPCSSTSIVYKVASSESECQQTGDASAEPRRIDLA